MEDKFTAVFNYLHKKQYPMGANKLRKRIIRRTAALFDIKDGEVMLKGTRRKWVPHDDQQKMILRACHDNPIGKKK